MIEDTHTFIHRNMSIEVDRQSSFEPKIFTKLQPNVLFISF